MQWGKLFQVLEGLGVRVMLDIPDAVEPSLRKEQAKVVKRVDQ